MKNRLQFEKSPYLLQHGNNPVDWYPWGEEAFKRAENENKPIFLSIGYSTCHWCHVMERESFEDEEVAQVLNQGFICIKVDREERPDIDNIYMNICQITTGDGGWPLNIFMNYEKKPFFAGTYFPKYNMYGRIGLISLLKQIKDLWENDNDKLLDISNTIIKSLNETTKSSKDTSGNVINRAYEHLKYSSDKTYGGFSYAPKFPMPHNLMFLLKYWYINKEPYAKDMVEKTLDSMYNGGIYDHIGFGFSRYSTDSKWLVPHFEKMLYDNALLAIAYLEYYQICKKEKYAQIANDIFTFIKREMTDKEGTFYSAQDADSESIEGKYYVWEIDEIIKVLGEDEGKKFCDHYNITKQGNFEEKNIPNLIGKSEANMFREDIQKLYNYRNERVHPFKDDKILTSWNGLMIAALAIGGRILKNSEYIDMAKKAAYFILNNMITENGEIYATHREGVSKILGFADDYAFFIWSLLEIYESTFEEEFLEKANSLNNKFMDDFWDEENGGFFLYSKNSEQLITRPKEIYDGAIPSANSVSILNLIRLSKLVENSLLEEKANDILKSFAKFIENNPGSCTFCLANMLYKDNTKNVVLVGEELSGMINKVQENFNPFTTTLIYTNKIKEMFPNISEYKILNNSATAYICEGFKCNPPSNNI